MRTLRLHVGPLDDGRHAYPIRLFDLADSRQLAPAAPDAEWLPPGFLDPNAIIAAFNNPGTLQAALIQSGQQLFAALHRGKIAAEWDARRAEGATILLDIEDETLRRLPWELMADGAVQFFGRTPGVARYHRAPVRPDPTTAWPYRLLVVVGSEHLGPTGATQELRRLKKDLLRYRHSIDLEVSAAATADALRAELKDFQPHFVHYIGHSGLSHASGLAVLFLTGGAELDAQQISTIVNQSGAQPRLVFLNACRTAGAVPLDVAAAFVGEGAPALLMMQGDIQGDLAGNFAARVYEEIWTGTPLDAAVAVARGVLAGAGTPQTWAFPVLSLAIAPDAVCPPKPPLDKTRERHIDQCTVFHDVRLFTGRSRERRDLRRAFCPIAPTETSQHLKIVTGESQHGKSYLVKRCLEGLALGGHDVQYVEVADGREKTFVDVVLDLLHPDAAHGAAPIPTEVHDRLRWDVHCILTHGATRPWDGTRITGRIEFKADEQRADDPVTAVFAAVFAALEAASATRPLLIVLDHFRTNPASTPAVSRELFRDTLWPRLFGPILNGALRHVAMVLVMLTTDALNIYGLDGMVSADQWLRVHDLDRAAYLELAEEVVGYPPYSSSHLPNMAQFTLSHMPGSTVLALKALISMINQVDLDLPGRVGLSR